MKPAPIQSTNWTWQLCNLYHEDLAKGQEPVCQGDLVTSFRGEPYTIIGGSAPHKPSSSGRVLVTDSEGHAQEFYPGVFSLRWIPIAEATK